MREGTTSRVMAADRPYGEFYDFYSVSPEYFGYIFVIIQGSSYPAKQHHVVEEQKPQIYTSNILKTWFHCFLSSYGCQMYDFKNPLREISKYTGHK
jgi:hypothetical protein